MGLLYIGLVVAAIAAVGATVERHRVHLRPRAPYRMNSFSYNATAGGPSCALGSGMLTQGGHGGRPAPLAWRSHRIPTRFLLNLHGIPTHFLLNSHGV